MHRDCGVFSKISQPLTTRGNCNGKRNHNSDGLGRTFRDRAGHSDSTPPVPRSLTGPGRQWKKRAGQTAENGTGRTGEICKDSARHISRRRFPRRPGERDDRELLAWKESRKIAAAGKSRESISAFPGCRNRATQRRYSPQAHRLHWVLGWDGVLVSCLAGEVDRSVLGAPQRGNCRLWPSSAENRGFRERSPN